MKKWITYLCLLTVSQTFAFELDTHFENDDICIKRVKIMPGEDSGDLRNEYTRLISAIQGGTLIRVYKDGTEEEWTFPVGETLKLEADAPEVVFSTYNSSEAPIEFLMTELKKSTHEEPKIHTLELEIAFDCPRSDALQDFIQSIPDPEALSEDDWKPSFLNNLSKLASIVETDQIAGGFWSISIHDPISLDNEQETSE